MQALQALMMERQKQMTKVYPKGIAISNLSSMKKSRYVTNVLIINPGLGRTNLKHFESMIHAWDMGYNRSEFNFHIVEGIHTSNVNSNSSLESLLRTINAYDPELIIAGSRGAQLIAALFQREVYKGRVLLFGPTKVKYLFESNENNNVIVIVHGAQDQNEKIERVRMLVDEFKHRLVEASNKGHDMGFKDRSYLLHCIRYTLV
jgi:hypothetical protein